MSFDLLSQEKVIKYLDSIGIMEPIRKRIESLYKDVQKIFPEEQIIDIFVEDYIQDDGTRKYQHIAFYTKNNLAMSVNEFMSSDDIRVASIKNNITYIEVHKTNYDFVKATESSRLIIQARVQYSGLTLSSKASKENCDYLKDIMKKYIIPNFIKT
jgi:hypothetical protein